MLKHHEPSARRSTRRGTSLSVAERTDAIDQAIASLRRARDLLRAADAPLACGKVRDALKSAEGALRHADNAESRMKRREVAEFSRRNADEQEVINNYRARKPLREVVENGIVVRYDSKGERREMGAVNTERDV